MSLGPLTRAVIAAVVARLEEVLGLVRNLMVSDAGDGQGCEANLLLVQKYLDRSLTEIQAEGYKTNDIVVIPGWGCGTPQRRVMINGCYVKLTVREALLLRLLVDHTQRLGARRQQGFANSILFQEEDLRKLPALVEELRAGSDLVSRLVRSKLSSETRRLLADWTGDESESLKVRAALVQDLNRLVAGPSLAGNSAFAGLELSRETKRLLRQQPSGAKLVLLNRLLLQDAFPDEFVKLPSSFLSVDEILAELVRLNGEEGLEGVWRYPTGTDVYRAVDSLRATLSEAELNEHLIEGERGAGYRLSTAPWNVWVYDT